MSTIDIYYLLSNFRVEKQNELYLERHLKDIFRELSDYENNNKEGKTYITAYVLVKYLNLPLVLTQKICNSISEKDNVSFNKFHEFFMKIQSGCYETVLKVIFDIYDFNKDGIIYINDCRLILAHIAFNNENRIISNERVFKRTDQILERTFVKKTHMTLKEMKLLVEKRNSDIFLIPLIYILLKLPFNDHILGYYHHDKRMAVPKKRVSWIEKAMVLNMSENCTFFIGDDNFKRLKLYLNSIFDDDELELQRLENDSISDFYDLSSYTLSNYFNNKFTIVGKNGIVNEQSTSDACNNRVELRDVIINFNMLRIKIALVRIAFRS
jgi:Ca2+-binding EF-hand superfamily protein